MCSSAATIYSPWQISWQIALGTIIAYKDNSWQLATQNPLPSLTAATPTNPDYNWLVCRMNCTLCTG